VKVGETVEPASLIAVDEELDLCLLNSSSLPVRQAQIRSDSTPSVGETVYAIGAPHGLELSLSNGIVSQLREHPSTYRLVQTTAPISKGSSGGGLFDADGRLIGITTFYISDAQNLNFAVPATAIEDLWHASLVVAAIWHVARTPDTALAAMLDQAVPGWGSDADRPSFRRWLGLARDSKGRRRDGGVSFFSALDPDPADWQAVIELFRNYRASPFYGVDKPTSRLPRPESRPPVWELIAQGNDFTMYADRTRIRRQGARWIAWTLSDYHELQQGGTAVAFRSAVRTHAIECETSRIGTLQAAYYAGEMGSGGAVGSYRPTESFDYAFPGSLLERLISWVCEAVDR
jgi:hypothetical protein